MKIDSVMTQQVLTCTPQDTLADATRQMWEADVGCLVVVDDETRPVGMITDRDIVMAALTQGCRLQDSRVSSAMSKVVFTCYGNTRLSELEDTMRREKIRRVPVVDASGRLIGIATLGDLAQTTMSNPLRMTGMPGLARTLCTVTERRAAETTPTRGHPDAAPRG